MFVQHFRARLRQPFVRLTGGAIGILVGCVPAAAQSTPPPTSLPPPALFASASPAVVTIKTANGGGSGVLVDGAGVVATNLHVVRGVDRATVTMANGDAYDDVSVIEFDERRDLILLKIKGFNLPTVQLGDSDSIVVGQKVYTIGAPKGLELTLAEGLISAVRDSGEGYRVIQTTAPISPGSSGGGLFDELGRLIGITSFKVRGGENLNFAIPINYVRGMLATTEKMTLAALASRLPASDTTVASKTSDTGQPSGNDGIPRLQRLYRTFDGNALAVIEQDGAVARLSFTYAANGYIYGTAVVTWDARAKAFKGPGNLDTVCGQFDTRIWKAPVQQEIYIISDGAIRDRWTHPTKVNCDRQQVTSSAWQELLWYRPDTK